MMANMTAGLCVNCFTPAGEYIVCPHCGYDNGTPLDPEYHRPGSVVGSRYMLGRLVRKNGESAVYTGLDNNIKQRVFIREYYPHTIARRDPETGDVVTRDSLGVQYKALMSGFVDTCNEVRRMSVTEPVVPVEDVLADHGTVYAVYKDLQLVMFEQWLHKQGGKLTAAEAREILLPILNCLSNLHAHGFIHRGVSPYTVYISPESKLYLWDFCQSAAHTAGSELEAELFNGYSAPEQYSATGWQGTWTDVYGAAALFYRTISGFVPPKSTMIGVQRPLAPLIDLVMDLPQNISDAVAEAMEPAAEARTQEVGTFVSRLVHTELSSTAVYDVGKVAEARLANEHRIERKKTTRREGKYMTLGLLITVVVLAVALCIVMLVFFPQLIFSDDTSSSPGGDPVQTLESEVSEDEEPAAQTQDLQMPSLVGQNADTVMADPQYEGRFQFVRRDEYNDTYEEGVIYDHSPGAGVTVPNGRTVILYVSKGPQTLVMPDLIGKTRAEVQEEITRLSNEINYDLTYYDYTRYTEGAQPGTVVNTTPAAGTKFNPKDTRIDVWFMSEGDETQVGEAIRVERESSASSSSSQPSRRGDGPDTNPPRD